MLRPFNSVRALAVVLVSVLVSNTPVAAQTSLRVARAEVLSLDMITEPQPLGTHPASEGAAGVVWTQTIPERAPITAASGQPRLLEELRLLVRFASALPAGHVVRFLDASGVEVETVRPAAKPVIEIWSLTIPGRAGRIVLERGQPGKTPAATIFFAYPVLPGEKQSITPPNELAFASTAPPRLRQLARSVARLRFMIAGEGQATCTAFLVGARLMLTNQHCITNDQERQSALVDFNYDSEDSPLTQLRLAEVITDSPELDYALLRLASDPPVNTGRLYFAPLNWGWNPAPAPHPLMIVQHPSGWPKHVSIADCRLDGSSRVGVDPKDKTDFGHQCDTLGGSSGSPVMDWTTGLVVGLHHFGFVAGAKDPVNQAVIHSRILEDIRTTNATAYGELIQPKPAPKP